MELTNKQITLYNNDVAKTLLTLHSMWELSSDFELPPVLEFNDDPDIKDSTMLYKSKKFCIVLSHNRESIVKIIDKNWETLKYLPILQLDMSQDYTIDITKLCNDFWFQTVHRSRIKRKLIDNWIIANKDGVFYLNPALAMKKRAVPIEIYSLFDKKNKELYNITSI